MYKTVSGIYLITCKSNGDRYIGSSKSILSRRSDHWNQLRNGKSHNKHLQSVWNKYGEDSFVFELLERVENTSLLLEREQYWIDTMKPELNKSIKAESGFLGQKHSVETIERLREIQKNRLKNPELIERLRQSAKEQNARQPNATKGTHLSEKTKQHLREKTTQQFSTPESRKKHSEIMRNWCTPEMREKIGKSKRGVKPSKEAIESRAIGLKRTWNNYSPQERRDRIEKTGNAISAAKAKNYAGFVSQNGTVYKDVYNLRLFCKQHNLNDGCMNAVDRGKRKSHHGWRKLIL